MSLRDLTDAIGVRHTPVTAPARIVSLVPSITELLFALKLGDQVVGRTHYCIHPAPLVMPLPSVGAVSYTHLDVYKRQPLRSNLLIATASAKSSMSIFSNCDAAPNSGVITYSERSTSGTMAASP